MIRTLLIGVALLAATTLSAQETRRDGPVCGGCHRPAETIHDASSHHARDVGCVQCHGGDAAALEEKTGHGGDFRGKIARQAIPALCAECHSDGRRMHPFGISTDQFKLYSISAHGEAVLRHGKTAAAVCTDCHGTHNALSAKHPDSTVNRENLTETCSRCHADPKAMAAPKLDTKISELYRGDVHGKALLRGDKNAPTCATCHGSHAATAPGSANVADVCGRCHEAERNAFHGSAHGSMNGKVSKVRCVDCHDAHGTVEAASLNLVDTCKKCHEASSKEGLLAIRLGDEAKKAEDAARATKSAIADAQQHLLTAGAVAAMTAEIGPLLERSRAEAHSLNVDTLIKNRERLELARDKAKKLGDLADEKIRERGMLIIPIVIIFGGLASGILLASTVLAARRQKAGKAAKP